MNKLPLIVLTFITIFISGCNSLKTTELTIDKKEVIKISIPEVLLRGCKPDSFMSEEEYFKLNYTDKEKALSEYIVELYGNLDSCNKDISSIKKLNIEFIKQ